MSNEINELTELAYDGAAMPLTTSPVVGTPARPYADLFVPGTEPFPRTVTRISSEGAHTSPAMAGKVFELAGARMSAMWHLVVDHETVSPVFSEVRAAHDGPVVMSQDLTVFNITQEAVVARQATIDPYRWPVVGPTIEQGPPMNAPLEPPAWWADALITD